MFSNTCSTHILFMMPTVLEPCYEITDHFFFFFSLKDQFNLI